MLQSEHCPGEPLEQGEAVVLCVDWEMGVVAEQQGLAQQTGVEERGEDEKAGGGEMDDVWVEVFQGGVDAAEAEGEGDAAVEREAEAGDVDNASSCKLGRGVRIVVGDDNKDIVTGMAQLEQEVFEAVRVAGGVGEGGGLYHKSYFSRRGGSEM